jgi:hypothetical protein
VLAQQASGYEVKRGLFVVKEKPMVALVDVARDKSVEVVERVGSAIEARPTEIPSGEDMSATCGDVMAKPIEQPGTRNMWVTRRNEAMRPTVQSDTGHIDYEQGGQ